MSAPQFTPGPWLLDGQTAYALDESGNCNRFSVRPQGGFVFRSASPDDDGTRTSEAELSADAYLIAAAPELYEAAERALESMECAGIVHIGDLFAGAPVLATLKAALAKARGEQ